MLILPKGPGTRTVPFQALKTTQPIAHGHKTPAGGKCLYCLDPVSAEGFETS